MLNVNNVLQRLYQRGEIRRPQRGVYSKPYLSKSLGIELEPEPGDIATAIARKNSWVIAPAGQTALNRLGLSTQVPAVTEYVSSGPDKTYAYNGFTIKMRHRANRDLLSNSPITQTFIQALKALGKDSVGSDTINMLAQKMTKDQADTIYNETRNATSWVFKAAQNLRERYA
jgi:hypothetical protein